MKSHYHSDLHWQAKPHGKRFPRRRAKGRGGWSREPYSLLCRSRPQEQMVASAQAHYGGGARVVGAEKRVRGGAGLMAIGRRDQKRGAGPRFPQAGGGGRAGARGQGRSPGLCVLQDESEARCTWSRGVSQVPTLPAEPATHLSLWVPWLAWGTHLWTHLPASSCISQTDYWHLHCRCCLWREWESPKY